METSRQSAAQPCAAVSSGLSLGWLDAGAPLGGLLDRTGSVAGMRPAAGRLLARFRLQAPRETLATARQRPGGEAPESTVRRGLFLVRAAVCRAAQRRCHRANALPAEAFRAASSWSGPRPATRNRNVRVAAASIMPQCGPVWQRPRRSWFCWGSWIRGPCAGPDRCSWRGWLGRCWRGGFRSPIGHGNHRGPFPNGKSGVGLDKPGTTSRHS